MRRHRYPTLLACLVAATFVSGCAIIPIVRHPDFKARQRNLQTVAILPPRVEVYKVTFKGDQKIMYDLIPTISQSIADEMETTLKKRGYSTRVVSSEDESLAQDPSLKQTLYTVQELFDKRVEEFRKRMFGLFRKFEYSVGADVNVLADFSDSDALMFVRCTGLKKTGGEIAKDWAQSILISAASLGNVLIIPYASATMVQMGVVDGNTGDILWYADNSNTDQVAFDIAKEKKLRKVIRQFVSAFPKAATLKPSAKPLPQTNQPLPKPAPIGPPMGTGP